MRPNARVHRVHRAVLFIEPRLFTPLTVKDVAAAVGGSVSELHRQVTDVYGVSVAAYIRARRLSEAARMLREGDRDVLGIALRCRYSSQAAFTRAFRRQFGVPPGAYREGRPALHAEVCAASVQELVHRESLPRAPTLRWLHEDRPLTGLVAEVDPECLGDFQAVQEALARHVGDGHQAVGLELGSGPAGMRLFLGVDDDASLSGLEKSTLLAGLYAVFRHRGPPETVRHSVAFFVQTWRPGPGMRLGSRPAAEVFDLRLRHGAELEVELWVAVDAV